MLFVQKFQIKIHNQDCMKLLRKICHMVHEENLKNVHVKIHQRNKEFNYPCNFREHPEDTENSYPLYRRRKQCERHFTLKDDIITNQWISPYNICIFVT
jgi:hypothetical protein